MDISTASYKRFWEPNLFQTLGLSLFAGTVVSAVTYPFEFFKTVIQFRSEGIGLRGNKVWIQGYNPWKIMRQMHSRGGGYLQFYEGFQAHIYARLSYLVIRNSLYKLIYDQIKPVKPTNDLTKREKAVLAGLVGGIAAYVTSPLTLISIRQILDTQTKPQWRRNYTNPTQALNIINAKGLTWKGARQNALRHVLLNISLTGPYDYVLESMWTRFGDYFFVEPCALIVSAMVGSAVTLPMDNIRTRLMQAHSNPQRNRLNYKGAYDVVVKSLKYEGTVWSLWSGYYTFYFSVLFYSLLTTSITQRFTTSWKLKKGLKDWQI